MVAIKVTGGIINASEVPCASCCDRPRKKISDGITIIAPPTPNVPLKTPATKPMIANKINCVSVIVSYSIALNIRLG